MVDQTGIEPATFSVQARIAPLAFWPSQGGSVIIRCGLICIGILIHGSTFKSRMRESNPRIQFGRLMPNAKLGQSDLKSPMPESNRHIHVGNVVPCQ